MKKQENLKELVKTHKEENIKEKNEAHIVNQGGKVLENEEDTEEKMGEKLVNQIERHDKDLNNDIVMARPDLLLHTSDLKNESLVISEMNKEKILNENFNKTMDELHSNGDKRLAHIEHIDTEKVLHGKKKDDILEGKNADKQLGDKKDSMVENKGEQLVNQIERHDNDLNNDIVMARPDLLVHTFDIYLISLCRSGYSRWPEP